MELFDTFSVGEHYSSAIVNADYSGLNETESVQLNDWLKGIVESVAWNHEMTVDAARARVYLECDYEPHFTRCVVGDHYSTCCPVHIYVDLR